MILKSQQLPTVLIPIMHKTINQLVWFTVLRAEGRFSKTRPDFTPRTSDYKGSGKRYQKGRNTKRIFTIFTTCYGAVHETDMRAMFNPRMKVIEMAACKLSDKIFITFVLHANGRVLMGKAQDGIAIAKNATIPLNLFVCSDLSMHKM